jgi:hypothetical protein
VGEGAQVMAGELAGIITAATGLLGALGLAAKFLWNKIEARFLAIDVKLEACEQREHAAQERSAKHVTVIELLWQEVERLSPDGSRVLARALKLLDSLKKEQD